jgi:hypothetical protein
VSTMGLLLSNAGATTPLPLRFHTKSPLKGGQILLA